MVMRNLESQLQVFGDIHGQTRPHLKHHAVKTPANVYFDVDKPSFQKGEKFKTRLTPAMS